MSIGQLIGRMALFVLFGAPMVWYLWESLNQLLSGQVDGRRLLISVPVLLLFLGLLTLVSRAVHRWDAMDQG